MNVVTFPASELLLPDAAVIRLLYGHLESLGARLLLRHSGVKGFALDATSARWSDVDLLHIHWIRPLIRSRLEIERFYLSFFEQLHAIRKKGVPVVYTLHNWVSQDGPKDLNEEMYQGFLYSMVDAIIVHCRHAQRKLYNRFRLTVDVNRIPHGLLSSYPDTVSGDAARAYLGIPRNAYVYLFFGFMKRYKGIEKLITTFKKMRGQNLRLLIAGEPTEPEMAHDISNLAAGDIRIAVCLKYIPDDQVQYYFHASNVVVLPYLNALTSGVLLTALAFKKPAVVPRTGCLPEYVGSNLGMVYDPGDPTGLEKGMINVRGLSGLLFEAALARMRRRLSWPEIAQKTLTLYKRVIS